MYQRNSLVTLGAADINAVEAAFPFPDADAELTELVKENNFEFDNRDMVTPLSESESDSESSETSENNSELIVNVDYPRGGPSDNTTNNTQSDNNVFNLDGPGPKMRFAAVTTGKKSVKSLKSKKSKKIDSDSDSGSDIMMISVRTPNNDDRDDEIRSSQAATAHYHAHALTPDEELVEKIQKSLRQSGIFTRVLKHLQCTPTRLQLTLRLTNGEADDKGHVKHHEKKFWEATAPKAHNSQWNGANATQMNKNDLNATAAISIASVFRWCEQDPLAVIEDYALREPGLEDVFLRFAAEQQRIKGLEEFAEITAAAKGGGEGKKKV